MMKKKIKKTKRKSWAASALLWLCLLLLSGTISAYQQNITAGTVSTTNGETEVIAYIDGQQSNVVQFTNSGSTPDLNYTYVIVRASDETVLLKENDDVHNFKSFPLEIQRVYGIAHTGKLKGIKGKKITDDNLSSEDFAVSENFIKIIKVSTDSVPPNGGILSGGPFTFCINDSIPNTISGLTLENNTGANSKFIITRRNGKIIRVLDAIEDVEQLDYNSIGPRITFLWHISFANITGLKKGTFINTLNGDFDLSNSIRIRKLSSCTTLPTDKSSDNYTEIVSNAFPNPFDAFIRISNTDGTLFGINLFNPSGQLLQKHRISENDKEIELETTQLVPGIYFIKLTHNNGSIKVLKVLKNNML